MSNNKLKKIPIWPLILILVFGVIIVLVSPEEKSLGSGIKSVYVHVALTWMGMLSLTVSGAFGLYGLFFGNKKIYRLVFIAFGVSIAFYILGYFASMISSYINWGGVPFQEPRFISSLNVIIAAILSGGLMFIVPWERFKSALAALPIVFIFWTLQTDRMALHPDSAVETAPLGIRLSFYGMFLISFLFYLWWLFYLENRTREI
jgi:hypothetical protein